MAHVTLTEADNNGSFGILVNESITIQLEENRSTAYMWRGADKIDPSTLQLVRDEYILPGTIGVGEGGVRILEYVATAPGMVSIELRNRREWESEGVFISQFKITVTVKT